ncbi:MAG: antibiotic biosynthesis monooxygenase, partial [Bryobacteraceae bacterium]
RLLAAGAAAPAFAAAAGPGPIHLHTDVHVKAGEEAKLIDDFHKLFRPRIRKAPGFIDAKLVKFVKANVGKAPTHTNYRLIQVFESEALREAWTTVDGHKLAWHTAIESHLKVPFDAYLFQIVAEHQKTTR